MRKVTGLICIGGVILLASFAGKNSTPMRAVKSDCAELNLKGRIHSICESLFDANVKVDKVYKTSDKPQKIDSTWFDAQGNKLDEKIYGNNGAILSEWKYTYDDNENLLVYVYSIKGKQRQKDTYKYDSSGRQIEWVRYKGADSLFEKDTYLYDKQGNQNEQDVEEHYPVRQNIHRYYEFDERGNRIKENEFKLGGSENLLHTWTYNAIKKPIEEDDYLPDGRTINKIMFKYNSRGDVTERTVILSTGTVSSRDVFTYNANGNRVEYDMYNNFGKLYHYYTYSYDAHNNIKDEKEFKIFTDEGPQMEDENTYELDYDKTGNWIKKTDLKIDGTVTLTQREIAYY